MNIIIIKTLIFLKTAARSISSIQFPMAVACTFLVGGDYGSKITVGEDDTLMVGVANGTMVV
ncbi:hypothetical protein HanXRQr2_Chr12g0556531 [Helianthus annuus]|uniref:Uncharacterized protein n=1 Tax=Helianthus annuus TaxID=4232 RepID=A0A9K3MXV2_HELAN|nr:hypothetical protein HanXRQr2_Chr12g0556531 [Helianthus annuus]